MSGKLKISIVILALLLNGSVNADQANEGTLISMDSEENLLNSEGEDDYTGKKIKELSDEEKKSKKKTASQKYYENLEKQRKKLEQKTKGFIMDLRKNNKLERMLPWVFYLPFSAFYLLVMGVSVVFTLYMACKLICKKSDPSDKEIEKVDSNSINQITLEELTKLNKERGDDRLTFGQLMMTYTFLNLRTEFEPDDVFSQQTAIMAYVQNVKQNSDSYTDSQVVADENDQDGFNRMTKQSKIDIAKTSKFSSTIHVMCYLSIIASSLALIQIFGNLWQFERILVLNELENALLRICFGIVILFITYRDTVQILINLGCRFTGAVGPADHSRFMFVETILRIEVTTLACLAILFTIFSTPKDDVEGIIDQTMNFTALVVLLEIDNILAGVFQKKIDKLEVDFEYNQKSIPYEFNRAADYVQQRGRLMPYQSIVEQMGVILFTFLLFIIVTFLPIFLLLLYVVQPIPE